MGSKGETLDSCGLTELEAAVRNCADRVQYGDLSSLSGEDVVAVMQRVETCQRQLSALGSKLIIEASDRGLPESSGAGSPVAFLRHTLHLTRHDASTRIKIAAQVGEFHQANGQLAPPVLEVTAEAYEAGDISRDHVRNIVDVMNHLPADVPVETRAETEQILVNYCCEGWPDDLPRMGREILARLDPEGTVVSDADRHRRRGIKVGRPGIDGMSWIEGWITPQLRALLDAFFAKYARPGMCNSDDADSPHVSDALIDSKVLDAAARRDRRDAGQRVHDAFIALLQPDLDLRKLGSHRGMPVQVTLQMNLADLERGSGLATTASGVQMSINEALKMAGGTRPVLIVNDDKGIPLYLGYGQRIASCGQRWGLLARDRGCTFPGCDAPADMCAAHHVTDWVKGGPTDLDNLALVCDHHHALVNDSVNGWKTVMLGKESRHSGRIGWIAPKALDPTATPRVNEKHHVGQRVAAAVEASCREWGSTAA
ncbi:HNH endonuclease signature motif containing protein [Nocardia concava]|uniref:HNH endonuclease signature motif containing protein n=1 Tax=Nocardia concava TaxID=257281 RepID=UPI0003051A47|nr:HNH endonuclease signature motif containing protein [Nocardia concava]